MAAFNSYLKRQILSLLSDTERELKRMKAQIGPNAHLRKVQRALDDVTTKIKRAEPDER